MPRSFALTAESSSTVEEFHSAFRDEQYWRARVAAMGNATLDSLVTGSDGTVAVATTFRLLQDGLPTIVARLRRGDLVMVHNETWRRMDGGGMSGDVSVRMSGVSLSVLGSGSMTPEGEGSQLKYTATIEVKVPLIGGPLESFIGSQLTQWLLEVDNFTTSWVAENG
jgi:Protein of unknown function (DUF2505)